MYRQFKVFCARFNSVASNHGLQLMCTLARSLLHKHARAGAKCICWKSFCHINQVEAYLWEVIILWQHVRHFNTITQMDDKTFTSEPSSLVEPLCGLYVGPLNIWELFKQVLKLRYLEAILTSRPVDEQLIWVASFLKRHHGVTPDLVQLKLRKADPYTLSFVKESSIPRKLIPFLPLRSKTFSPFSSFALSFRVVALYIGCWNNSSHPIRA